MKNKEFYKKIMNELISKTLLLSILSISTTNSLIEPSKIKTKTIFCNRTKTIVTHFSLNITGNLVIHELNNINIKKEKNYTLINKFFGFDDSYQQTKNGSNIKEMVITIYDSFISIDIFTINTFNNLNREIYLNSTNMSSSSCDAGEQNAFVTVLINKDALIDIMNNKVVSSSQVINNFKMIDIFMAIDTNVTINESYDSNQTINKEIIIIIDGNAAIVEIDSYNMNNNITLSTTTSYWTTNSLIEPSKITTTTTIF